MLNPILKLMLIIIAIKLIAIALVAALAFALLPHTIAMVVTIINTLVVLSSKIGVGNRR